jgi:protein-L-isoaspartate(D-aspartate) O-methyltransferase
MTMNTEQARFNMIEQQIRPWNVLDTQVLDLMATLPREQFVPESYKEMAFADISIPVSEQEKMFHPREEGRMLQAVKPSKDERVLVLGACGGYVSALLASLAKEVVLVDDSEQDLANIDATLKAININNVTTHCADPILGKSGEQFDVIVVLGSMEVFAEHLKQQVNDNGRIFCVLGTEPTMSAVLMTKQEQNWKEKALFETNMPAIVNTPKADKFHF